MKLNFDDKLKVEWSTAIGIFMIIIGVLLVTISAMVGTPTTDQHSLGQLIALYLPRWSFTLFSDLGTGLVAAGILTITLERSSRKRHKIDVLEVKEAHTESILKGIMPEAIFEEVKAHIIRQPFVRTNFDSTIELTWVEEKNRDYLFKSDITSYEIENISRTLERFDLYISEERVNENIFSDATRIEEIKISLSGQNHIYREKELAEFTRKTEQEQHLEVVIPINLKPGDRAKISMHVKSILSSRDVYSFVLSKPTIGMKLTIIHPEGLQVRATPMHSSRHAFVTEASLPTVKIWRVQAGILPYQGLELSWNPIKVQNVDISRNDSSLELPRSEEADSPT